jgi:hypothetical protein
MNQCGLEECVLLHCVCVGIYFERIVRYLSKLYRIFRCSYTYYRLTLLFNRYRSSVELDSTALSAVPGHCRGQADAVFYSALCWFS